MRVLVTGGTGFVGRHLLSRLEREGHSASLVSRKPNVGYDWTDEDLRRAVLEHDAVVHLAGAGVFDRRWTESYKREIRASRTNTTRMVAEACAAAAAEKDAPRLVSSSAVGYYGSRHERGDEDSPAGDDFLASVCRDWEAALEPAREAGVPTAWVRTGVVLGTDGGALKRMLLPFKLGMGGPLGSGSQPFPWIHVEDLGRLFAHLAADREHAGPFNGVAPGICDQRTFARVLGKVLGRPAFLPAPAFALRLALGEGSTVLLEGQDVAPRRTLETGFAFEHPDLEPALEDLLSKKVDQPARQGL